MQTTVLLSGACVMVLEMLGIRMFAPYLGSSMIVLTSIIAVVMGGLSIGYHVGGKWADQTNRPAEALRAIFLIACVLSVGIALFEEKTLYFSLTVRSISTASLIASFLLFGPINILFGAVTPLAVKALFEENQAIGRSSGTIYAISTIGSIAGTILAGFVLVPHFSITTLTLLCGLVLFLNAMLLSLIGTSGINRTWITFSLFAAILLLASLITQRAVAILGNADTARSILLERNTPYNHIRVWEGTLYGRDVRVLSDWQSAIYTDTTNRTELAFPYFRSFRMAEHFAPSFAKTLLIGGAGYSYPRFYLAAYPEKTIDVVEIDPTMIEVAKEYFDFEPNDRFRNFTEDGRIFLNANMEIYDVIYLDAFSRSSVIPFHLATREAMERMHDSLAKDGVLIMNTFASINGRGSDYLQSQLRTIQAVFPTVLVFPLTEGPQQQGNIMFVALKKNETPSLKNDNPDLQIFLDRSADIALENGHLYTDRFAPLEYEAQPIFSHCFYRPETPQCHPKQW